MFYDVARRYVFRTCMEHCGLDDESLPNFNGDFYYNRPKDQKCLETCFNSKMDLHFGEEESQREALYMNF